MSENKDAAYIAYCLEIMKALGWYLDIYRKELLKKKLAEKMNFTSGVVSHAIIPPQKASEINESNYTEKKNSINYHRSCKRLLRGYGHHNK